MEKVHCSIIIQPNKEFDGYYKYFIWFGDPQLDKSELIASGFAENPEQALERASTTLKEVFEDVVV
jgi:hypothetical protein